MMIPLEVAYIDELAFTKRHGGSAITTTGLSNYLNKEGFETRVFSFSQGIKTAIPDKIKLFPNIRELIVFPYIGKRIIPTIERKFHIIHFSSTTTSAFYKANVATVLTINCLFSRQTMLCRKLVPYPYKMFFNIGSYSLFKYLEEKSLQNIDHIIAPKVDVKNFLVSELNISENDISVIHQGVDTKLFTPADADKNKENYVLFVGRGTVAKGFDTLIEASNLINAKIVAIAPHIMQCYRGTVKKNEKIILIEKIDRKDIIKLYQKAKVFVMPSLSETGPLVTLEAMACGLPIVCTPEGGGDFVEDGVNGLVIPPREPKSLAEKVNFILDNESIERRFGKESRRRAEAFSLQNTVQKTVKIYESLI